MADQPQEHSNVGLSQGTGCRTLNSRHTKPLPCGACKYTKRRCHDKCPFAPYFNSDQGLEHFALIQDVFGAKHILKMLNRVDVDHRHDVVASMLFEARARSADPVHGSFSIIRALKQEAANLREELAKATMQNHQLINTGTTSATLLESPQQHHQQQPQQPPQPNINLSMQPFYSNNSTLCTNFLNMNSFNPSFGHLPMQTTSLTHTLEPLQSSTLSQHEEENMIPQVFNNDINLPVHPPYNNNPSLYTNFVNNSSFNPGFDPLSMQTTNSAQSLEPLPFSTLLEGEEGNNISSLFNNETTDFIP